MAVFATHIRAALELEPHLGITNQAAFLSGTVYPDSRYLSGLDRKITHNKENLPAMLKGTDFQKGQAVHLLYDHVGSQFFKKYFPEIFPTTFSNKEEWISASAMKNIEDMESIKHLAIKNKLTYSETPNGESPNVIKKFNIIVSDHINHATLNFDDFKKLWSGIGVADDLVGKIVATTKEYFTNRSIQEKILSVYPKTIDEIKKSL